MLGAERLEHHDPALETLAELFEHLRGMMNGPWAVRRGAEKAELLLAAARYLNETLEPERVYDRFRELLGDAVPHDGVVVSSFDPETRADPLRVRLGRRREARPDDLPAAAAEPRPAAACRAA